MVKEHDLSHPYNPFRDLKFTVLQRAGGAVYGFGILDPTDHPALSEPNDSMRRQVPPTSDEIASAQPVTAAGRDWLDRVTVEPSVFALQPDYRALIIVAEGLRPGPSDDSSDALLAAAESSARKALDGGTAADLPPVAAWRLAYQAFGAKPKRTRPSVEALLRRIDSGLPRIDRLTDIYNAMSVQHLLPIGGEDLDTYIGPARLARAGGDEPFDTMRDGQPVVDHPEPGEVVWRDDVGVTCRAWNWRQCVRTRITHSTTRAVFILDCLAELGENGLAAAQQDLVQHIKALNSDARLTWRLLSGG